MQHKQILVVLLLFLFQSRLFAGDFKEMEARIIEGELPKITSVLARHEGELIYENYFNGATRNSKHNVRSASKSLTAILLGQAIEEGKISSVKDRVFPYLKGQVDVATLPDYLANSTFEEFLNMNPPMDCNDWNNFSSGHEERMYLQHNWLDFITLLPKRGIPPWEKPAAKRPFTKAFSYCTAGVFLVGAAIEAATGQKLSNYAQKKLFTPLNEYNLSWPFAPTGHTQSGGGLEITSTGLLKIGQLLLDKGTFESQSLIPQSWVDEMLQERIEISEERRITYGYLWWIFEFIIESKTVKAFAASGNGGNYLFVVPDMNLTAVVTSQAYNSRNMHQNSQEIFTKYVVAPLLQ